MSTEKLPETEIVQRLQPEEVAAAFRLLWSMTFGQPEARAKVEALRKHVERLAQEKADAMNAHEFAVKYSNAQQKRAEQAEADAAALRQQLEDERNINNAIVRSAQ